MDFFWTARHLLAQTLVLVGALLAIFYAVDSWYYHRREELLPRDPTPDTHAIDFDGAGNFFLLGVIVVLVLVSGVWNPGVTFHIAGLEVGLPGVVRDVGLIAITMASLRFTSQRVRAANQFSWGPMQEVAKLFAGIFLTIVPVIAMVRAGVDGPFGALITAVTRPDGSPNPAMYFWASGALSSFLDNAPTYLVFFNIAGGDAAVLMTSMAPTLAAISAGSVFMGAVTYIGNAPNIDGQGNGRGTWSRHAQFLRLHGLVACHTPSAIRPDHAVLVLLTQVQRNQVLPQAFGKAPARRVRAAGRHRSSA